MSLTKHIPNTITSLNLLCGVVGVILAMEGRLDAAFVLMLLAALFDFCDGFAARLLKAYSDIGKELDSLCDVVSFGVLPSVMLFRLWDRPLWPLGFLPLLLAVFSALRLAKFNIDERQHDGFLGLPTPAAAMICGSLAHVVSKTPDGILAGLTASPWFIPALTLCLCALLVCEVPMFSVKLGGGNAVTERKKRLWIIFGGLLMLSIAMTLVAGAKWSLVILVTFAGYVLINLIAALFFPERR